jgi:hypothetical protein
LLGNLKLSNNDIRIPHLPFIMSVFGDKTTAQKHLNRTSHPSNVCHVTYADDKKNKIGTRIERIKADKKSLL